MFFLRLIVFAGFVAVWQYLWIWQTSNLVPAPWEVAGGVVGLFLSQEFYFNLSSTFWRIILSVILSYTLILSLILPMVINKYLRIIISDLNSFFLNIPPIIFVFLYIIIFGLKKIVPILIITSSIFPQIVVLLNGQLLELNKKYFDVARVYKISKLHTFKHVIFPQLMPFFHSSLKLSVSQAWRISLLAETFLINRGIGHMISRQFQLFSIEGVLVWTIAFILVFKIFNWILFGLLNRIFVSWVTLHD